MALPVTSFCGMHNYDMTVFGAGMAGVLAAGHREDQRWQVGVTH